MAVKQTGRKVYKSMQGKTVDMDLLRQKNELTPRLEMLCKCTWR